ncbi:PaaI family thioesterase [Nocardioides zeae]|uniref:PaaI family thioesterase n=1 Tax=Nocardioides imazamoxiresistens TaxID=3231893 RepID=A0ABU3PSL5_9ACTN|nr:PaaI family thioesterase [Nocardioides zeae]MDT9592183.1 PaaI family thioesterase [Nocardioides zeae]
MTHPPGTARARAQTLDRFLEVARGGSAEAAFRVASLGRARPDELTGSMPATALRTGADGWPAVGGLGVLVDDVLGFAIIAAHPALAWSVSAEISIDVLGPLPREGELHVTARASQSSRGRGFASCEVRSDSGALVAMGRQHGRYVAGPAERPTTHVDARAGSRDAVQLSETLGLDEIPHGGSFALRLHDPRRWANALGNVHGGASLAASEATATHAAAPGNRALRTTSVAISYLRPAPVDAALTFRAQPIHRGRSVEVLEVVGSSGGRVCTHARVTRQSA